MENIYCANPFEQFKSKEKKIIQSIKSVLKSNKYILGPQVEKFENKFSKFIGSKYAIGVSNGTDAVFLDNTFNTLTLLMPSVILKNSCLGALFIFDL